MIYRDREHAGEELGSLLLDEGVEVDVVLGIPRGGLPVAAEVADALDAELDVVAAKKLGAPHNPELAIGAAAADGSVWLNEEMIRDIGVDDEYVEDERSRAAEAASEKEATYREGRLEEDVEGRRVLVVDDGVATGATAIACLRRMVASGADWVGFAAPVGAPDSVARLEEECDAVFCPETPAGFSAVGGYYELFDQVSDERAMSYLGER